MELEEVEALKALEDGKEVKGKEKEQDGETPEVPNNSKNKSKKKKDDKPKVPAGSIKLTQLWKYASNFHLFLVAYVFPEYHTFDSNNSFLILEWQ